MVVAIEWRKDVFTRRLIGAIRLVLSNGQTSPTFEASNEINESVGLGAMSEADFGRFLSREIGQVEKP
jgi:hypothetical protein